MAQKKFIDIKVPIELAKKAREIVGANEYDKWPSIFSRLVSLAEEATKKREQ